MNPIQRPPAGTKSKPSRPTQHMDYKKRGPGVRVGEKALSSKGRILQPKGKKRQLLRLLSDVGRLTLALWARSVPAILLLPDVDCVGIRAICRFAPFRFTTCGSVGLSNFEVPPTLLACFTLVSAC